VGKKADGRDSTNQRNDKLDRNRLPMSIYNVKTIHRFKAPVLQFIAQTIKAEPVDCRVLGIVGNVGFTGDRQAFEMTFQEAWVPTVKRQVEFLLNGTQLIVG